MTLPNFICVGAQKAGSSSLYKLLKSHPEIYLTEQKELHFFNIESEFNKGLSYYSSFFNNYDNYKCIGECTPDYLQYEFIPQRIKDSLGLIKIIIILRNPVDRAFSQFNFHKMLKHEDINSSFEEALKNESPVNNITERKEWYKPAYYKSKSLYFSQVKRYIDIFGFENVNVIIFEEMLKNKTSPNLVNTLEFLGVDSSFKFTPNHSNPTVINLEDKNIKFLRKTKQILNYIIPKSILTPITKAIVKKTYKSPEKLDLETKKRLFNTYFSDDTRKLEELLKINLSIWK